MWPVDNIKRITGGERASSEPADGLHHQAISTELRELLSCGSIAPLNRPILRLAMNRPVKETRLGQLELGAGRPPVVGIRKGQLDTSGFDRLDASACPLLQFQKRFPDLLPESD
jgi:hypothetical protein